LIANPGKTINIYKSIQQKVAEGLSSLWIGEFSRKGTEAPQTETKGAWGPFILWRIDLLENDSKSKIFGDCRQ
jgi:hypothetical protein